MSNKDETPGGNLDDAAERLKRELNLVNSNNEEILNGTFVVEQLKRDLEANVSNSLKYVVENYQPVEGREGYEAYNKEDTEIMSAILNALPLSGEEIAQLRKRFYFSPLYVRLPDSNKGRFHEKKTARQLSISTLIKHYCSGARGKKGPARSGLQNRFDHQSFTDQMKIMRLFLKGTKVDREWCYGKLLRWWDDALAADLEQAWLEYHDKKCVRAAALRLPEEFIKEQAEAMGELDYKSVSRRLAHDENYIIDKSRLTPEDYCFVIAHNHRHISDQEADQLLFGHIKRLLLCKCVPMVDSRRIEPSLFLLKPVRYLVWALGQTGNASTIVKFHFWNKTIKNNFPLPPIGKYERWSWDDFTRLALSTIPVFLPEDGELDSHTESGLLLPDVEMDDETLDFDGRLQLPNGRILFGSINIDDECPF